MLYDTILYYSVLYYTSQNPGASADRSVASLGAPSGAGPGEAEIAILRHSPQNILKRCAEKCRHPGSQNALRS